MAEFFTVKSDGSVGCNLACTKCALGKNAKLVTNCMKSTGSNSPVFFILGHSTGVEDDKIGKPHTGSNGRLLREFLAQAGIPDEWLRYSNCLRCASHEVKPGPTHWKACQNYLIEELKEVKPQAIISLGGQALSWLTGFVGVTQFRRRGLPCVLDPSIPVYPLTQPVSILQAENAKDEQRLRAEFVSDLLWLKEKAEAGTLSSCDDMQTDYRLAETVEEVKEFLREFEDVEEIVYDLETADKDLNPSLDPLSENTHIVLYALSKGPGHARAIPGYAKGKDTIWWWSDVERQEIHDLLTKFFSRQDKWFRGWNSAMYDNKWIYVKHGVCPKTKYDGMFHHYLIDENLNHDLEGATVQYTKMAPWKPPTLKLLMKDTIGLAKYACKDADATSRLALDMPYDERQCWLMENLLIPISYEYMLCEINGIAIDKENHSRYGKYLDDLISKHATAIATMDVVRRYEMVENVEFNPDAPHHVAAVMENYLKLPKIKETTKTKGYSTDSSVLEHYLDNEFVQHIYYLKKLTKLKSTYWEVIHKEMLKSNIVHTRIRVTGTVTGRPTSQSPNLFTIPRSDTIRKTGIEDVDIAQAIFAARSPKRKLVKADMSQIEVRVLGALSEDKEMIRIFNSGGDFHQATAAKVFSKPVDKVTKGERSQAKACTFGLVYAQSEKGLGDSFVSAALKQAKEAGVQFTAADEAKARQATADFIRSHKATFPQVWSFLTSQERIVMRQGFQQNPFGRRKHYTEFGNRGKRQSFNWPIQSTASDLFYFAMIWCMQLIRESGLDAILVLTVYDAIVVDCAEEHVDQVALIIKSVMEEALPAAFDWLTLPLKADVEVGPTLGDMEPWTLP